MKKELQDKLFSKYPKLFAQKDLSIYETSMVWGIDTGNGWFDLLDTLCYQIQNHLDWKNKNNENVPQVEFTQIKEKLRGLRVYYSGGDDYIDGVINFAEGLSYKICDICGAPAKGYNNKGWLTTRCVKHKDWHWRKPENLRKGAIALDFDGVLNSYKSNWVAVDVIPDPPVEGALDFIRDALNRGFDIYIFSTRNIVDNGKKAIYNWLSQYGLESNYLDLIKFPENKPIAKVYIDDRAWEFNGKFPDLDEIERFVPWHGGSSSSQKTND